MAKHVACLYGSLRVRYYVTMKTGSGLTIHRRYPSFVPQDGVSTNVAWENA